MTAKNEDGSKYLKKETLAVHSPLKDGLGFCRKIQINNVHPEKTMFIGSHVLQKRMKISLEVIPKVINNGIVT